MIQRLLSLIAFLGYYFIFHIFIVVIFCSPSDNMENSVTAAVISHGHEQTLGDVLDCLTNCPQVKKVVLVENVQIDRNKVDVTKYKKLVLISNPVPKGFAENNNLAFGKCETKYFLPNF